MRKPHAVKALHHAHNALGAVPDALRALDHPADLEAVVSRARDALAASLTAVGSPPSAASSGRAPRKPEVVALWEERPGGELDQWQTAGTFDLADQSLGVGDVFRWPADTALAHRPVELGALADDVAAHLGVLAEGWRITAVVDPDIDGVLQRVTAVRVEAAGR